MGNFWVFGYGSLIWNPGFSYVDSQPAKVYGFHRSLCIHSWVHRGTQQNPGLVLGLDKGGSCNGMAFKVQTQDKDQVIDYLRKRELVTDVYKETWCKLFLPDGNVVSAVTYIVDRESPQYSGKLQLQNQVEIVNTARGKSGHNSEYILKTVEHLKLISIRDHNLELIANQISQNQA